MKSNARTSFWWASAILMLAFTRYVVTAPVTVRSVPGAQGTITVTSPLAGENYLVGKTMHITWTYSGKVGSSVKIILFKGPFSSTTLVNSVALTNVPLNVVGHGANDWVIPAGTQAGSDYRILVASNENNAIRGSSAPFALVNSLTLNRNPPPTLVKPVMPSGPLPLLFVTLPRGGSQWMPGSVMPIAWTNKSSLKGFRVNIELWKGDAWGAKIASDIPVENGSFQWTIPADFLGNPVLQLANQSTIPYSVRIAKARDQQIFGSSDDFNICFPGINFDSIPPCAKPAKGGNPAAVIYKRTAPCNVIPLRWTYRMLEGKQVTLWLALNPVTGSKWQIAANLPIGSNGKGRYDWVMTGSPAIESFFMNSLLGGGCFILIEVNGTKYKDSSQEISIF